MFSYILRRLLLIPPTLLGISAVVFFIVGLSPGGVGANLVDSGGNLQAEEVKALQDYYNKRYGLDKPLAVQYGRWLNQISPLGFRPGPDGTPGPFGFKAMDFGYSYSRGRPVMDLIAEALPVTLMLNLITVPLIYSVAVYGGILAARRRGGLFDVASGGTFMALWCVPVMWAGVMLIGLLANRQHLYLFPTGGLHDTFADAMPFLPSTTARGFQPGWLLDSLWHLVLPVVCLSYGGFAFLSRLTRSAVLENLAADYARTARAKGVDEKRVLFVHVLGNSLLPLITVAASILPGLLAGSVVVESMFSLPGMGRLSVEAAKVKDRELLLALTFIAGLIGLLSYLLSDVLYAAADPRVSYE